LLGLAAFFACATSDHTGSTPAPSATTSERDAGPPVATPRESVGASASRPDVASGEDAGYPRPNGIEYRGGPIITTELAVYLIWYGDWRESTKSLVKDFVAHLGGSPYYAINTTYWQYDGRRVPNAVNLMGVIDDDWSLGKDVIWQDTNTAAVAIVSSAVARQKFPADPGAVFVVLVSGAQRAYDSPCLQWCAWHDHMSLGVNDIKIAMVWDPEDCPSNCTAYDTPDGGVTPNGDLAADGIVSLLAHEIDEAVTDPDLDAWRNPNYAESADLCAWTFGTTYATDSGAQANMRLGDRDWLAQQNWVNADGGYCATKW
jgi:hypothetical protein